MYKVVHIYICLYIINWFIDCSDIIKSTKVRLLCYVRDGLPTPEVGRASALHETKHEKKTFKKDRSRWTGSLFVCVWRTREYVYNILYIYIYIYSLYQWPTEIEETCIDPWAGWPSSNPAPFGGIFLCCMCARLLILWLSVRGFCWIFFKKMDSVHSP